MCETICGVRKGSEPRDTETRKQGKQKMKKMITLAATLLVVGIVQAASMNWGASAFTYEGQAAGDETAFYNVWLIDLGTSTDISGISVGEGGVLNGATALQSTTFTGLYVPNFDAVDATAGHNYVAVIFSSSGGGLGYWGASAIGQGVTDPTDLSGNTLNAINLDNGTDPWGWAMPAVHAGTEVVPEPTSMALLALGVAALGLRRKIRK
jgi:hypothetical protein